MLKLNRLTIIGFKSQHRTARVNFASGNISVIYGDNGSGKTSLLKILYGIFAQKEDILMQEKVKQVVLEYANYSDSMEVNKRATISYLEETNKKADKKYDWLEFEQSELITLSSILIGIQRGTRIEKSSTYVYYHDVLDFFQNNPKFRRILSLKKNYPPIPYSQDANFQLSLRGSEVVNLSRDLSRFLNRLVRRKTQQQDRRYEVELTQNHAFLKNMDIGNIQEILIERYRIFMAETSKKIQNALFDTLATAMKLDASIDSISIPDKDEFLKAVDSNRERIIESLESLADNPFKDEIIKILKNIDMAQNITNRYNKVLENELLSEFLFKLIKQLEPERQFFDSIDTLVDIFNEFLIEEKKLILNQNSAFVQTEEEEHFLEDLSSGERHILTLLTLALIEGENRDFFIIDEPEISLNITWQRKLLPLLSKLIPNTQIIVASHSPSIAHKHPEYLVELSIEVERNV